MAKLTPKEEQIEELSEREELFAQEIARGATASSAYRKVFNAEDWQNDSVWTEASKLRNQPKVLLRIKELQELAADEAIVDKTMVLKGLLLEAEWMGEGSSHSARVTAWKELGKAIGMFDEKIQVEQSGSIQHNHNISLQDVLDARQQIIDDY